jgi:hypothetical protein
MQNWYWDPMLATHILDNRSDITALKFQAFVQFGVADYDSAVHPFLEAVEKKNGNAVNRIDELIKTVDGQRKLLIYNGLDSIYEYMLAMKQMDQLGMKHGG